MPREWVVTVAEERKRLDHFLVAETGLARTRIQQLIKAGGVMIDDVKPTVHHWLKPGERIVMADEAPVVAAPPVPPPALRIVDEVADYVVLNKQVGVIVHPAPKSLAPVLTEALVVKYPEIAEVGDPLRPGIVHRLDREVSGLMVVARTPAMYTHLVQQFKNREVRKRYVGLVQGVVAKEEGVLNFVIERSKTHRSRMAAKPAGSEGRPAETRFTVLQRFDHHTLLEFELITGRTHQIRAHCQAFSHPLVGETIYHTEHQVDRSGLGRVFLQCTDLGFTDLQNEPRNYHLELEPELTAYLATLL